jgi:hypothetical protein
VVTWAYKYSFGVCSLLFLMGYWKGIVQPCPLHIVSNIGSFTLFLIDTRVSLCSSFYLHENTTESKKYARTKSKGHSPVLCFQSFDFVMYVKRNSFIAVVIYRCMLEQKSKVQVYYISLCWNENLKCRFILKNFCPHTSHLMMNLGLC